MIIRKLRSLNKEVQMKGRRKIFYSKIFSKNDLVFDIGANLGNRTTIFLDIGAKVIAVEPNPQLFIRLKKKYKKAIVIDKAVGQFKDKVNLYINEASVLSTTSKKWIETVQISGRFGDLGGKFNNEVEVEQITINNIIDKHGVPKFVKLDTEGTELKIIESLNSSEIGCISFEFAIPESKNDVISSIKKLESIGYKHFNISFGESMEFLVEKNIDFNSINKLIESLPEMSWGDIYAFNS